MITNECHGNTNYLIIPGAAEQRNWCDTEASDWGWVDWLIDRFRVKLGFCCGCFLILISDEAGGSNVRHLSALFFCALRCFAFLLPGSEFLLGHIIMHVLLWWAHCRHCWGLWGDGIVKKREEGQYMKLQLMRNARVISLAYLHRCGLCRKDVTRNLHPSGEFQNPCVFGFWGKGTCSFSFYVCYPPLRLDYSCKKGERFPNFLLNLDYLHQKPW